MLGFSSTLVRPLLLLLSTRKSGKEVWPKGSWIFGAAFSLLFQDSWASGVHLLVHYFSYYRLAFYHSKLLLDTTFDQELCDEPNEHFVKIKCTSYPTWNLHVICPQPDVSDTSLAFEIIMCRASTHFQIFLLGIRRVRRGEEEEREESR